MIWEIGQKETRARKTENEIDKTAEMLTQFRKSEKKRDDILVFRLRRGLSVFRVFFKARWKSVAGSLQQASISHFSIDLTEYMFDVLLR